MISLIGNNLTAGYGGVDIIKNITLEVKQGEIAVIVGPNGAGINGDESFTWHVKINRWIGELC